VTPSIEVTIDAVDADPVASFWEAASWDRRPVTPGRVW
jgi:hypothetical protein